MRAHAQPDVSSDAARETIGDESVARGPEPGELPSLAQLRRAVPVELRTPSTVRSLAYLALDLAALVFITWLAWRDPSPWLAPVWAAAKGTLLWSLFVIGHDCGHGSFSRSRALNAWVGHLTHTLVLVPYHGWRLSHARHHRHVADADRDEGWHPLTDREVAALPPLARWLRFQLPLLTFPFYLVRGTPRRGGSHFDPGAAELFAASQRYAVRRSAIACAAAGGLLLAAAVALGPGTVALHYGLPYLVFVIWIDVVTLLHHTDGDVPWYRGDGAGPVLRALSSVDRRYGLLEAIHHHAGHHVAHHLLPEVPHYHLVAATRRLRHELGPHYRRATEPIGRALWRALRECRSVPDEGSPVYYRRPSGAESRPATR